MGYNTPGGEELGVIPRLCEGILSAASRSIQTSCRNSLDSFEGDYSSPEKMNRVLSVELSLSYYEIYNEKVHDLLSSSSELACRVRESKEDGAFVENLCRRDFASYADVTAILSEGNKKRIVAATLMNSASSRSHAVFTVYVSQQIFPGSSDAMSIRNSNTMVSRQSKV